MTVLDRVRDLITQLAPKTACDDCIAVELGSVWRVRIYGASLTIMDRQDTDPRLAAKARLRDALKEGIASGPSRPARTAGDIKTAGRNRLAVKRSA